MKRTPPHNTTLNTPLLSPPVVAETPDFVTQRQRRPMSYNEDYRSDFKSLKEELLTAMKTELAAQSTRLVQLENHMKSIREQNATIQSTNMGIETSMHAITADIKTIESSLAKMDQDRKQTDLKIASIDNKLEELEIASIKTTVEVRNVPKVPKESKQDLYDYVTRLCKSLKFDIQQSEIRDVYRAPSKREATSSSVCVDLTNTLKKIELVAAVKLYNKHNGPNFINSSHLGLSSPAQQIYISELLTPKAKRLLFLARDFARSHNYAFAWPSNGHIFLRKEEGKPHIMLKSEAQLSSLQDSARI